MPAVTAKRADIVGDAAVARRDEIGSATLARPSRSRDLLAQRVQRRDRLVARLVGIDDDVVALGIGRPEADHGRGAEPFLVDDLLQHRLRVVEERARGLAELRVVEDRRDICRSAPRSGRTASSRCTATSSASG